MTNTNISKARTELFKLAESCIKFNDVVNINTKNGNVIMLSEEEFNGMKETLYLLSIPGMREKLIDGMNTPLEECEDFKW